MIIQVKVKPASKEEKIIKISDNNLEVWVKEPPIQGRANRAIIKALAGYFQISLSSVSIISGRTSRLKTINIQEK